MYMHTSLVGEEARMAEGNAQGSGVGFAEYLVEQVLDAEDLGLDCQPPADS